MGSRGASAGIADNGKRYGTEFVAKAQFGEIKIVRPTSGSTTAPMETMTPGRIYATLNPKGDIKHISFYDDEGKRVKQIDYGHKHEGADPHTHYGYEHDENGSYPGLSEADQRLADEVREWWNKNRKKYGY